MTKSDLDGKEQLQLLWWSLRAPAERREQLSQGDRRQDGSCRRCGSQGGRRHEVGAVAVREHGAFPVQHIAGPAHASRAHEPLTDHPIACAGVTGLVCCASTGIQGQAKVGADALLNTARSQLDSSPGLSSPAACMGCQATAGGPLQKLMTREGYPTVAASVVLTCRRS